MSQRPLANREEFPLQNRVIFQSSKLEAIQGHQILTLGSLLLILLVLWLHALLVLDVLLLHEQVILDALHFEQSQAALCVGLHLWQLVRHVGPLDALLLADAGRNRRLILLLLFILIILFASVGLLITHVSRFLNEKNAYFAPKPIF